MFITVTRPKFHLIFFCFLKIQKIKKSSISAFAHLQVIKAHHQNLHQLLKNSNFDVKFGRDDNSISNSINIILIYVPRHTVIEVIGFDSHWLITKFEIKTYTVDSGYLGQPFNQDGMGKTETKHTINFNYDNYSEDRFIEKNCTNRAGSMCCN